MKKSILISLLGAVLLSACGDSSDNADVVGPEDYAHFSDYFTMDESTADEMNMDKAPTDMILAPDDPYANILRQPSPEDAASPAVPSAP